MKKKAKRALALLLCLAMAGSGIITDAEVVLAQEAGTPDQGTQTEDVSDTPDNSNEAETPTGEDADSKIDESKEGSSDSDSADSDAEESEETTEEGTDEEDEKDGGLIENIVKAVSNILSEPTLIASFDFDNEGLTANADIAGEGAVAKGTYKIVTSRTGDGALELDGKSQYLTVTKPDGSPFFSGDNVADEMTLSYDVKYLRNATNWTTFVAPNSNEQTYQSEKYIGSGYIVNNNNPLLMAERYYSDNMGRPGAASTSISINDWYHVDVVYAAEETTVYVNGESGASAGSEVAISRLMGDSSVFYIGRANWGKNGEFSQMDLDNFKIYKGALSAEQVANNYQEFLDSLKQDASKETIPADELEGGRAIVTYVSKNPAVGQNGGMTIAVEDQTGYTPLHKGQPIMYTALGQKAYVSPQIFKTAEGGYKMIANDGGSASKFFLYDTDLVNYTEETEVEITGIINSVTKLYMIYDKEDELYKLFVEDGMFQYMVTSADLRTFSEAKQVEVEFPETVQGAPSDAQFAAEVLVKADDYDRLVAKYTNQYATSVSGIPSSEDVINIEAGATEEEVEAALNEYLADKKVNVSYSDDTSKTYSLRFTSSSVAQIDTSRAGEYTLTGVVGGSANYTDATDPLIPDRADPYVVYNEDDGYYYFTASYPMYGQSDADGYDRLILRRAKTISGLATAEEVTIWDEANDSARLRYIWAPEIHKIGGSWYFISTASNSKSDPFSIRPFMVKCNNADDMMNPASWGEAVNVKPASGDSNVLNGMSLDMTYFKDAANGQSYLIWPDETSNRRSDIWIAKIDESNPTQLTSAATKITFPEYTWEQVRYHVNEGPAVFVKDGTIYLAFSAAGTGSEYCVGLMTASAGEDLTVLDNWTKLPYPIMTSGDFDDEVMGPGHNSFTYDENGNLVIVYHARETAAHSTHSGDPLYDACRSAYVKTVFFDEDGVPVFNLTGQDFAGQAGDKFTVKAVVTGESGTEAPFLAYDFDEEQSGNVAKNVAGDEDGMDAALVNGATYAKDDKYGQVLYLNGSTTVGGTNAYLQFPTGAFDGKNRLTISMDVNEITRQGNYFTFALGKDTNKYMFLKTMPTSTKFVITKNSYSNEKGFTYNHKYPNTVREWINVKMVIAPNVMQLYMDGELVKEVANPGVKVSELGDDLVSYLGKSFFSSDTYFRGYFDNVKFYDYAMNSSQVAEAYAAEQQELAEKSGDIDTVAANLVIPNASDIRGNITLLSEKNGVDISWSSSDEATISTETKANDGYDSTPAGVVTRGASDKSVTLTATLSKDGQTRTKNFAVTVKAAVKEVTEDDMGGYLFVHFTGNEQNGTTEQTYFSVSEDGLNWTDLNNNQPVLSSTIGESGLRDHYIGRSAEGDKFYMIATDLSIALNQSNMWPEAGSNGSHGIVVWESTDLVNWSEPWIAEIAPKGAGCTWAPEFIYDEITGEYVVFWASTTLPVDENKNIIQDYENHTIYYAKTRDFVNFTEAKVFHKGDIVGGKQVKVIDSTMIFHDGTYYRYTKNESKGIIEIDKSDKVLGSYETIPSKSLTTDVMKSVGAVEGPIIYKLNGQDRWVLMVDRYGTGSGYYPLYTDDLSSGVFTEYKSDEYSMPSKYRHGYVMPVTKAEYTALTGKDFTEITDDKEEVYLNKSKSGNPVLGFDDKGNVLYGGDPSILVDGDTVYAYVGHDTSSNESYYMPEWACYSSTNMTDWNYEGVYFNDKAANVSWAKHDNSAWAGQVIKYKDHYFFLYCTETNSANGGGKSVGIAVSDKPTTGFKDVGHPFVKNIETYNDVHSWEDIDPTGWIETDEDGTTHFIVGWGNTRFFNCEADVKFAEDGSVADVVVLNRDGNDNKLTVEYAADYKKASNGLLPDICVGTIDGMKGHTYTEAPYYYRQQDASGNFFGKYYIFFACDWREQMAYATADTYEEFLANEWKWGAVIQEPSCTGNTNHMAVFDFKGHTYFVYHDGSLPHGSGFRRVMCCEEFKVNADGTIPYIKKTAVGLTGTVSKITDAKGNFVVAETFDNTLNDADYPMGGELTSDAAKNAKEIYMSFFKRGDESEWEINDSPYNKNAKAIVSIESNYKPGLYIMAGTELDENGNYDVKLEQMSAGSSSEYKRTAFRTLKGMTGEGVTFESIAHPGFYLTSVDGDLILTEDPEAAKATFFVSSEERVDEGTTSEEAAKSVKVQKTKRMYVVGQQLNVNDLRAIVKLEGGATKKIKASELKTNVADIDMTTAGDKTLKVTVTVGGKEYVKSVTIHVVDSVFGN